MRNTILVDIKKKHFKGHFEDYENCPLALAIEEIYPGDADIFVHYREVSINDTVYNIQGNYFYNRYFIDYIKSWFCNPEKVIRSLVLTKN